MPQVRNGAAETAQAGDKRRAEDEVSDDKEADGKNTEPKADA
jgi:hypothetical protein